MKANEKSKFVYPDKMYARTKDNITLDISYAPQTLDAVEYSRTDAFIEKACEFVRNNIDKQLIIYHKQTWCKRDEFIDRFKNYMKGE